jgi:hypothetical protein
VLGQGLAVLFARTASTFSHLSLNEPTKTYPEGDWYSIDTRTETAACKRSGGAEEYELEFQRTGGSVFYADGVDFAGHGVITDFWARGPSLTAAIKYSDAGGSQKVRIKRIDEDRMWISESSTSGGALSEPQVFSRCGRPNHSTVGGVSDEWRTYLTPLKTNSVWFPRMNPGDARAQACASYARCSER